MDPRYTNAEKIKTIKTWYFGETTVGTGMKDPRSCIACEPIRCLNRNPATKLHCDSYYKSDLEDLTICAPQNTYKAL